MLAAIQIAFICSLMVCCVHGCKKGKPNCTCVTYFQATTDVLGPDHPRHLGSKVTFKATASWAFNLSLGFKAYVNEKLITTYPKSIYNMSCGSQMSRVFQFVNQRMDKDNPSGYPRVDIILYADHPDNPDDGALECAHYLCRRFQVYYHFPPGPENIDITLDPPNAIQGQRATVKCSTIDGYPQSSFGIRAFSLVYNLELFYSPSATLTMPAAISGTYGCEAITYMFGQRMVVPSDKKVVIAREHEPKTLDATSREDPSEEAFVKIGSRGIAMFNERKEDSLNANVLLGTGYVKGKTDFRPSVNKKEPSFESAKRTEKNVILNNTSKVSEKALKSFSKKTNKSKTFGLLRPKRQLEVEDTQNKGADVWRSITVVTSLMLGSLNAYVNYF